jgi:hypothetical protein
MISDFASQIKPILIFQADLDLPLYLFDPNLEKGVVAKYLESDINEQAKVIEDLQKLGASDHTVR